MAYIKGSVLWVIKWNSSGLFPDFTSFSDPNCNATTVAERLKEMHMSHLRSCKMVTLQIHRHHGVLPIMPLFCDDIIVIFQLLTSWGSLIELRSTNSSMLLWPHSFISEWLLLEIYLRNTVLFLFLVSLDWMTTSWVSDYSLKSVGKWWVMWIISKRLLKKMEWPRFQVQN